jgi:hypothetical protein
MNANGRLTAPPLEAALVTNSVGNIVFEGCFNTPSARGTLLATSFPGTRSRRRNLRSLEHAQVARSLMNFEPVSAAQLLSTPQGASARR